MSGQEIFYFEMRGRDLSGQPVTGMLDQVALTDQATANKMARSFEQELAEQQPERQLKVRAVGKEKVGPLMQQRMGDLVRTSRQHEIAARLLAAQLAEYKCREQLRLNPNRTAVADVLLAEMQAAALKLMQRETAAQHGLVDADGLPVKASRA